MNNDPISRGPRRDFLRASATAGVAVTAGRVFAADPADPLATSFESKVPATGPIDPRLASFDQMLASFVTLFEVPGASLAVARQGKLVYTRGMGFSQLGTQDLVQPRSRFRIASVSKPITAVAVLRLAQNGKLRLDDRLLDLLKVEPLVEKGGTLDPRWDSITIRQILQHRGGWDRDKSFDPMFRSVEIAKALDVAPPSKPEHIIRFVRGKPLDFGPGERSAYSNFGYCLLGRVIEKITGVSYEEAIGELILTPLGIRNMQLGKTLQGDRAEREVAYHVRGNPTGSAVVGEIGKSVPLPYGAWSLEAMDAHGGWIASAVDLVRFASGLDSQATVPLLNEEWKAQMLARPEGAREVDANGREMANYLGCGWMVVPVANGRLNTFHTGSLDGTAALLVRRHDGLTWAALFNTRSAPHGAHLAQAIDLYLHLAADKVREWPEHDLFADFL